MIRQRRRMRKKNFQGQLSEWHEREREGSGDTQSSLSSSTHLSMELITFSLSKGSLQNGNSPSVSFQKALIATHVSSLSFQNCIFFSSLKPNWIEFPFSSWLVFLTENIKIAVQTIGRKVRRKWRESFLWAFFSLSERKFNQKSRINRNSNYSHWISKNFFTRLVCKLKSWCEEKCMCKKIENYHKIMRVQCVTISS